MENYNYAFRLFFLSNEGDILFPSILLLSDVQFLCSVQFASLLPPEEGELCPLFVYSSVSK